MVQSGTPRDLYDRPASRFAAEFIGNANILEGTVAGSAGGKHALVTLTDGVTIEGRFSWPAQSTESGPVLVCIRAESIVTAMSSGPKEAPTASTRRSNRSISSERSSTACSRLASVDLRADLPARNPPDVGQTIMVRIDPEAVTLISEH